MRNTRRKPEIFLSRQYNKKFQEKRSPLTLSGLGGGGGACARGFFNAYFFKAIWR